MRALRLPALAAVLASIGIATSAPADPLPSWGLRAVPDEPVAYRGLVDSDRGQSTGTSAAMVYPGGAGLAGWVAGVLTHAAIVQTSRASQKERLQQEANQVLAPFRDALDRFHYPQLMQAALRHAAASGPRPGRGAQAKVREVSSVPAFSMTQDQRALILDSAISLFDEGGVRPAYSATVRVVSAPRDAADPRGEWLASADGGSVLKDQSARMVAHAIDLAWRHGQRVEMDVRSADRTLRYLEGGTERTERVQVLEALCSRVVVRNLRGWVLSLPVSDAMPSPPECTPDPLR